MSHLLRLDEVQLAGLQRELLYRDKAQLVLFRMLGTFFQQGIAQLVDMSGIPRVFIHGKLYLDNYAYTMTGAGLIDIDRSRLGQYVWDIVKFSPRWHCTERKKRRPSCKPGC